MADELNTGVCSPMSWWSSMRNPNPFDFPPTSISCATTISDEPINWTQPLLHAEFNQIQPALLDSSTQQFRDMSDQSFMTSGLFDPDLFNDLNESVQQSSWVKLNPQLSRVSSSNSTPFWNPAASSAPAEFIQPRFEDESSSSNKVTVKTSTTKKNGIEPASKRPRIETPSPLPTFKVRKEKLGDRITALQQLVSPFGKTDTASVLHEAIDYIKFLHGQVSALSTPYLKNGHHLQYQEEYSEDEGVKQDLRSRGLCLVPISSTFAVASETPMDFWAPTILGSYR